MDLLLPGLFVWLGKYLKRGAKNKDKTETMRDITGASSGSPTTETPNYMDPNTDFGKVVGEKVMGGYTPEGNGEKSSFLNTIGSVLGALGNNQGSMPTEEDDEPKFEQPQIAQQNVSTNNANAQNWQDTISKMLMNNNGNSASVIPTMNSTSTMNPLIQNGGIYQSDFLNNLLKKRG